VTDADPDPAFFVSDLREASQKNFFLLSFHAYFFLKMHLHHSSKLKSHKEVTKQLKSRFSSLFVLDPKLDPNPQK
jgi:hypothetical protein